MVTITEGAAEKVRELLKEQDGELGLRLFVKTGGCSGFSYGMALDRRKDEDRVLVQRGVPLYIDEGSTRYVEGAEIDYVDGLSGAGFTIHNPNAVSTCGCGASFRTKEEAGAPGSCD